MLDTPIQQFVFRDKYARYSYEYGRRETWDETVDRVVDFLEELSQKKLANDVYSNIRRLIHNGTISPSMRLMATAGKAARKNNLLVYNCSFSPITDLEVFPELLWLSMSGIGVGYSVEKQYINQLPPVVRYDGSAPVHHVVEDSAEGWVKAYK